MILYFFLKRPNFLYICIIIKNQKIDTMKVKELKQILRKLNQNAGGSNLVYLNYESLIVSNGKTIYQIKTENLFIDKHLQCVISLIGFTSYIKSLSDDSIVRIADKYNAISFSCFENGGFLNTEFDQIMKVYDDSKLQSSFHNCERIVFDENYKFSKKNLKQYKRCAKFITNKYGEGDFMNYVVIRGNHMYGADNEVVCVEKLNDTLEFDIRQEQQNNKLEFDMYLPKNISKEGIICCSQFITKYISCDDTEIFYITNSKMPQTPWLNEKKFENFGIIYNKMDFKKELLKHKNEERIGLDSTHYDDFSIVSENVFGARVVSYKKLLKIISTIPHESINIFINKEDSLLRFDNITIYYTI